MDKNVFQKKMFESLEKNAGNIAIETGRTKILYSELNEETNFMASFFSSRITEKNALVGILVNDKVLHTETIISLLKQGHIIVPLYSGYPNSRLKLMMDSINLKYLVIDHENYNDFKDDLIILNQEQIWLVEEVKSYRDTESYNKTMELYNGEDPAYVHFTSGTTGKPKAVLGKNVSLLHYLNWMVNTFEIDHKSRVSQFAIPGFDPFLKEILATILGGGTVCIPQDISIIQDSYELKLWLNENRITHIHCVSSLFRLVNNNILKYEDFKNLKYILLAGEKTNTSDLVYWYKVFGKRIQLVNCYGPTETTMSKVYYYIQQDDVKLERIPVGKPMAGAQVLILDENMNLCDKLVPGEIYIRTPYRSCGYCNDEQLTREKFIKNPFNCDENDIIYKTGDLGRYLINDDIDILGRVDRQVKIHGYRIELEEIESSILKFTEVNEAVVIKKEYTADTVTLLAFITMKTIDDGDKSISKSIKEYLSTQLPKYMIPSQILILDKIPRNQRGKVDYKELDAFKYDEEYSAPENEVQEKLVAIWNQILGKEQIGIDSDFIELGGNSLNVMSLVSRISSDFGVRIPLGEIFQNGTIKKQAKLIEKMKKCDSDSEMDKNKEGDNHIVKVGDMLEYDLSYGQKRIWFLSKVQEELTYNIPFKLEIEGDFNFRIANESIKKIIERHSILRTTFIEKEGIPKQIIHEKMAFDLDFIDVQHMVRDEQKIFVDKEINDDMNKEFDIVRGPLIRGKVFKLENNKYVFYMNIYHIIFDGWSMGIFAEEFSVIYQELVNNLECSLPEVKNQYVDYVYWENKRVLCGELNEQKKYWEQQLQPPIPNLIINGDSIKSNNDNNLGDVLHFKLDYNMVDSLKKVADKNECTIFMVLLSGYCTLLHKLTYEDDIIIGVPFAGRKNQSLESIIGFFVNTLPIRVKFNKVTTFTEIIQEVKKLCICGYDNEYPFDKLVSDLNPERNMGSTPYFSTVFLFHNTPLNFNLPNVKVEVKEFIFKNAKFDFKLDMQQKNNLIEGRFEYKKCKFKKLTIEDMKNQFVDIISLICSREDKLISQIFGDDYEKNSVKNIGFEKLD